MRALLFLFFAWAVIRPAHAQFPEKRGKMYEPFSWDGLLTKEFLLKNKFLQNDGNMYQFDKFLTDSLSVSYVVDPVSEKVILKVTSIVLAENNITHIKQFIEQRNVLLRTNICLEGDRGTTFAVSDFDENIYFCTLSTQDIKQGRWKLEISCFKPLRK
jgi:hypothetical protein